MKLTRDFHPSQVLLISKVQQYTAYGRGACYSAVIMLMLSLPFAGNSFAKGSIYLSQLLAFATGLKLEHLKKQISDDHYEVGLSRSTQGISSHLEASYAPHKREVALTESVAPMPAPSHPVLRALYNQKLECNLVSEMRSPSFVRTLVKPTNCTARKILSVGEELQLDLALKSPPIMSINNGSIAIDTPRSDRQIAKFADYWKPSEKVEAAIGVDINNKLISIDLSHPETCHILAAGTTGSGKSVWLQSLLLSLFIGRSPDDLQAIICDPKRVSFFAFKGCANLLAPIIHTPEEAIKMGNWLIKKMEERYACFAEYEVENIDQYNAIVSKSERLPRILFLIDEYGDLKSACDKKQSDEIESINIRIGEKARASGIIQAIITQRALKVITPRIRANCPARVLLKVKEKGDTECILGEVLYDGRDLLGRGDLFFDGDRLQSLLCEPSDFARLSKGNPVFSLEDLDPKNATVTVSSRQIVDSPKAQSITLSPPLLKIVQFLEGKDWTRDNSIKQSIADLKALNEPMKIIQDYLQYLRDHGYIEIRPAGRGERGLEARIKADDQ